MRVEVLYSKIHRARVSDANLNYTGSITIDENLARAAKLYNGMKVDVVNINNGERFSTYVILGKKGGEICLNGAAARKVQVGDIVIIIAYASMEVDEVQSFKPSIVQVDENNAIVGVGYEI